MDGSSAGAIPEGSGVALSLQVVGLPGSTYRRLTDHLDDWSATWADEVRFRFVPSSHDKTPLVDRHELGQVRANLGDGFAHIAVVLSRWSSRVVEALSTDCRVASFALEDPSSVSAADLTDSLDALIAFELRWKTVVGPQDQNHPLLLPASTFQPHPEVSDFWRTCDCYRASDLIDRANTALQAVRARHRRSLSGVGTVWLDRGGRRYAIDKSGHGVVARGRDGEKQFRFAFEVAPTLHYDVVHVDEREFRIRDRSGRELAVRRANVNPWGDVYPAKLA